MNDILIALDKVLTERKSASPDSSYVASLNAAGLNKILEKVGEEATEVILAAKDAGESGHTDALAAEVADLWFHTMVMLSELGLSSQDVLDELSKRFGFGGLDEKASRQTQN